MAPGTPEKETADQALAKTQGARKKKRMSRSAGFSDPNIGAFPPSKGGVRPGCPARFDLAIKEGVQKNETRSTTWSTVHPIDNPATKGRVQHVRTCIRPGAPSVCHCSSRESWVPKVPAPRRKLAIELP